MKKILILLTCIIGILSFNTVFAAIEYTPLAPIDGYVETMNITPTSFSDYLNNMFKLGIALCTALAVLMIIVGGIQYVSSDAWSKKSDGKERIFAALFGLLIAFGSWALLNTIDPRLLSTKLTLQEVTIEGIKAEFDKVYSQWTPADDALLQDPNNTGHQAAVDKWNKMQSEIKTLEKTHGPQVDPSTATGGPANQKVLEEINKGSCTTGAKSAGALHCSAGAEALGNAAGVKFEKVYQSPDYKVGNIDFKNKEVGAPREPLAGEMVDVVTQPKNSTPYHAVIVYSNNGNGNYTVWDWTHNSTTGLRQIHMETGGTTSNEGHIGRIYKPNKNK